MEIVKSGKNIHNSFWDNAATFNFYRKRQTYLRKVLNWCKILFFFKFRECQKTEVRACVNDLTLFTVKDMVAGLCHFVFSSFRPEITPCEKTKRRHAKRRKDEITPCEKTKRRNNATRKDEITKPATRKVEIPTRKDEKTPREKTPFKTVNL